MRRDNKEFRERFQRWKEGKLVYENGRPLPHYQDGKDEWQEDTDYGIPFVPSNRVKLTNAGYATGAVLSTNMLDSIADNAVKAGLPIRSALGLAVKESTLGNPTDDRTAWNLSSGIRNAFGGVYPGTSLNINEYGDFVNSRELINWWKDLEDSRYGKTGRSVLEGGFEFYRNNPNKYNPGQKNHPQLSEKRADELMKSPEIESWLRNRVTRQNEQTKRRLKNGNATYLRTPRFDDGKDVIDGGTPFEITVLGKDRRPAWQRMYQNPNLGNTSDYYDPDAIRMFSDLAPGVGDVSLGFDAYNAAASGDYKNAAVLGGMLLLPNILEKPLKFVSKPALRMLKSGYEYLANTGRNVIDKFIDTRILKKINQVDSGEKIEELFKSRMPYAKNNSLYVEPMLSTKSYNKSIFDKYMDIIRKEHPNASEDELIDIFTKTYQVTPEDLLNASGFVARNPETRVIEAASYCKSINPRRTMYIKTHEWNHTGFDLDNFDNSYTKLDTQEGTKYYLNENHGFSLNDITDENGLYLNADEVSSYMSEIKTMLGKKNGQKLTARELKFLNNNRTLINDALGHRKLYDYIFDHITNFKKFAEWANDHATAITIPMVGGAAYLNERKDYITE